MCSSLYEGALSNMRCAILLTKSCFWPKAFRFTPDGIVLAGETSFVAFLCGGVFRYCVESKVP